MRGQHLFERSLHARRKIMMALLERFLCFARRAKPLLQICREQPSQHRSLVGVAPRHLRALILVREIFEAQPERKRPIRTHDAAKFFEKFRLAVCRKPHHLVFVAKFPEAEILRQRRVIHPERVRKSNLAKDSHPRALAKGPHRTRKIAESIRR